MTGYPQLLGPLGRGCDFPLTPAADDVTRFDLDVLDAGEGGWAGAWPPHPKKGHSCKKIQDIASANFRFDIHLNYAIIFPR